MISDLASCYRPDIAISWVVSSHIVKYANKRLKKKTLNIEDLGHAGDFSLYTKSFGPIYCEQLNSDHQLKINKKFLEPNQSSMDIARYVLLQTGHKPDKNPEAKYTIGGDKLNEQEVTQITDDEIETFSREFIKNNSFTLSGSNKD